MVSKRGSELCVGDASADGRVQNGFGQRPLLYTYLFLSGMNPQIRRAKTSKNPCKNVKIRSRHQNVAAVGNFFMLGP